MIEVSLKQAGELLGHLVEEAAAGEDVVITTPNGPAVRLVVVPKEENASPALPDVIGHDLDRYFGTWSPEEAAELLEATDVFEQIDESLWT